jgi:hypothetical protein
MHEESMLIQKQLQSERHYTLLPSAKWKIFHGESIQLEEAVQLRRCQEVIPLPKIFFEELESYSKRNVIWIPHAIHGKPSMHGRVCLQCLKAFALNKARELHFSAFVSDFIAQRFDCERGHAGYFLDNAECGGISGSTGGDNKAV